MIPSVCLYGVTGRFFEDCGHCDASRQVIGLAMIDKISLGQFDIGEVEYIYLIL